jgi:hypothetical protein
MKTVTEKRGYERHCFTADIVCSYFNREHSFNARTLNLGVGGMCFESDLFLRPGATVFIRVKKIHPNGFSENFCEGLRSVTLAEIKWCKQGPDKDDSAYGVGVKYFESIY